MSKVYRIKVRKIGDSRVLNFRLPAAMSRVIPGDHHEFDCSFVDDGILLKYIGPTTAPEMGRTVSEEKPKWVKS